MAATLDERYAEMAKAAISDGVKIDDSPRGPVAAWVRRNVSHRPETAFFIVLGICGAMADIVAQNEGYKSAADRAACRACKTK